VEGVPLTLITRNSGPFPGMRILSRTTPPAPPGGPSELPEDLEAAEMEPKVFISYTLV